MGPVVAAFYLTNFLATDRYYWSQENKNSPWCQGHQCPQNGNDDTNGVQTSADQYSFPHGKKPPVGTDSMTFPNVRPQCFVPVEFVNRKDIYSLLLTPGTNSHLQLSQICRLQLKSSHIILAGFLPAPCVELMPFVCRKSVRNLHQSVQDSHIWPPNCCRPHEVFKTCDMIATSKYLGLFLLCAASQLASLLVALQ